MEGGKFTQEMAEHLSLMFDRAEREDDFITRVIKIKGDINNEACIIGDDANFVNQVLDDLMLLNRFLDKNREAFGRFLYFHLGIDCYLEIYSKFCDMEYELEKLQSEKKKS